MQSKYVIRAHNLSLMVLVAILNALGILVLRSASNNDLSIINRQIVGSLIGIVACLIVSLIDYSRIMKYSRIIYTATIVVLLLTLFQGVFRNGAGRWIVIPFVGQIQPAEFCKLSLIVFFASYFYRRSADLNTLRTLVMTFALALAPVFLVVLEPNLSTALIILVIFFIMLCGSGLRVRYIFLFTFLAVFLIGLIIFLFSTDNYELIPFIRDYQKMRILGFLFPEQYSDTYFQQGNSITAIASGGFFGKGLMNTGIESVKAGNFLIEEDTDFIFAIIGEELGFRGCLGLIAAYLLTIFNILWIGIRSRDTLGASYCVGVAAWIAFQTFTNIAVATAIFPNTGVTLPFISRGVSSLLALYLAIGIVMNIGYQSKE